MLIDQLYDHVPPPATFPIQNDVKNIKTKPNNSCAGHNTSKNGLRLNNFNFDMFNLNANVTCSPPSFDNQASCQFDSCS